VTARLFSNVAARGSTRADEYSCELLGFGVKRVNRWAVHDSRGDQYLEPVDGFVRFLDDHAELCN
jgi:hypothetical protein